MKHTVNLYVILIQYIEVMVYYLLCSARVKNIHFNFLLLVHHEGLCDLPTRKYVLKQALFSLYFNQRVTR